MGIPRVVKTEIRCLSLHHKIFHHDSHDIIDYQLNLLINLVTAVELYLVDINVYIVQER